MSVLKFKSELKEVLKINGSSPILMAWGNRVVNEAIDIQGLQDLILEERKTAMHFSWLLGGICMFQPTYLRPSLVYFFEKRQEVKFVNFDRSLAKFFFHAGIPSEIEGTVIDVLFSWLDMAGISVSTKNYALQCLVKVVENYPDLKNELVLIIENQLGKNTNSFDKLAKTILLKLGPMEI
ncbi:MAG TPA: hypothetical protein VGF79_07180 [Bacteroidia bacterium]